MYMYRYIFVKSIRVIPVSAVLSRMISESVPRLDSNEKNNPSAKKSICSKAEHGVSVLIPVVLVGSDPVLQEEVIRN